MKRVVHVLILLLFFMACQTEYTPKPKGYPRIILPKKSYQTYQSDYCDFSFEYPKYAEVQRDSVYFDTIPEHPCWINIVFPEFAATIYLSYKDISEQSYDRLIEDAYKMTFKHTVKAEYIDQTEIRTANNVRGIMYDVGGNAASSVQFFISDSVEHYVRGALYFNMKPNVDSIEPVISFVKDDIEHIINTLKWK